MRGLAAVITASLLSSALHAQTPREWTLTGKLVGPDSQPIAGATVRATQGPRTLVARTNDDGVYRITEMGEGNWTVAARSLGHVATVERLTFDPRGMRRDFQLERAATRLDPVLVASRWTGVRGVVGDVRLLTPLSDARIEVIGGRDAKVSTGTDGLFAVALEPGTEVVLTVEREGYARRVVTATVPASGYIELDVPLDTLREQRRDWLAIEDLDRRLKFASARSAVVGRDEIERTDAGGLDAVLTESPSLARKGITVSRASCLFVDGIARPGTPVDAIPAALVEFVEVYPAGTDATNSLAIRWPPRGECGAPGVSRAAAGRRVAAGSRRYTDPQVAEFVVIWTKAQ
jgi:hypothetical protein